MADESKDGSATTEVNLLDKGLTRIPADVAARAGATALSLNLSENNLSSGADLDKFTVLETLVLDKNELSDISAVPPLPTLKTLWFNNNMVVDLPAFLDQVVAKFPKLTYLSFMRNPAAPSMICVSEEDAAAMRRYRLYVVYRLPRLVFLDSSPVSKKERDEALKRGEFLVPRRPSACKTAVFDEAAAEREKRVAARPVASTPTSSASADSRRMSAYLGLGTSNYDGRHSEGNRFIGDDAL